MHNPLVTCLCLTRNRREWLPKAIACFLGQAYENRELLIVADSLADVEGVDIADSRIRLVLAEGPIGAKRNRGCEAAAGEVIAHWDDDDYSAPARIERQVATLIETGKSVTGYKTMKFTDGIRWWRYVGQIKVLGTSLCFTRAWWKMHPFLAVSTGEDDIFAGAALQASQLVREGDLDLMYATVHKSNTSPRQISNRANWEQLKGFEWKDAA